MKKSITVMMLLFAFLMVSGCGTSQEKQEEASQPEQSSAELHEEYPHGLGNGRTFNRFREVSNLTVDDLSVVNITNPPMYRYDYMYLDWDKVEEVKNSSWLNGKFDQGFMYETVADYLAEYLRVYPNGYEEKLGVSFSDTYSDLTARVFDPEFEKTQEELESMMRDAASLFVTEEDGNPLIAIMSRFSECETITGEFSDSQELVPGTEYHFEIQSLSATAEELGITEDALAYILGMIAEYTDDYEFDKDSYKCDIVI